MVAIQFQTVKEPVVRDTRDILKLREDLKKAQELQTTLLQEIRSVDEKIYQYESNLIGNKEQILLETLEELKEEAGLTEVKGPGIVLKIEPVYEQLLLGHDAPTVTPYLLSRLINELNMYGAKSISIADQRVIHTTVIREIQGETKIDGFPLRKFPIEIKVITENLQVAEKLYNRMNISEAAEAFFIDNLRVNVSPPVKSLTIPPYENSIHVKNLKPVKEEGEST
jgi:uncharacterized protein YlxW (UPF0749 family)